MILCNTVPLKSSVVGAYAVGQSLTKASHGSPREHARLSLKCAAFSSDPSPVARRVVLVSLALLQLSTPDANAASLEDVEPPKIDLSLAPDQAQYDKYDPELRRAANMIQEGLNAETVEEEERVWTRIIDEFSTSKANWRDDVVGRALGNRGNARSRQGKFRLALEDYNESIATCPWSVDPVLNRGVLLENLGRFDEAKRDYRAVISVDPLDPAGWNNLGNACAGAGEYEEAVKYYERATRLAPKFSFAAANRALSTYQIGRDSEAFKEMESLVRRYPDFSDIRAALAAAYWASGKQAAAEEAFQRVDDIRYRDVNWLRLERRWPPRLVKEMESFLKLQ